MIIDMLYRHWVTIFAILIFSIKLWSGKKFRNTENKFFWMTVISCFLLVLEDSFESFSSLYPSMRFFRTLLSVLGYTLRSTAALSLLLVVLPSKKRRFIYCVPSIITFLVCSTAFFTDIAFGFDDNYAFYRGPLGYVAFVVPILYLMMIMWIIFKNFSEKSSLEKYIMPVCAVFCLSSSFLDVVGGGIRLNEAIIISSIFFYLILFSNNHRRDPMTGLLNRQAFYDDCNLYGKSIKAVASLDMNGLKDLNDTEGHLAGDKALIKIGECLGKAVDSKTMAYRIGGDEFIVLFLHSNEDVISEAGKMVLADVSNAGYSISTGYAIRGKDEELEDTIRRSDNLMYQAKAEYYHSNGKEQRVEHYQPET